MGKLKGITMNPDDNALNDIKSERTLVLLKPDAVTRHIVGEILQRFERKNMKIIGIKMVWPTAERAGEHYADDEEWYKDTGGKTLANYEKQGVEMSSTAREMGVKIRDTLMESLTAGPVVALVLEGAHVIELTRTMRGSTSPRDAVPGTIGFDYTLDSYELSDSGGWSIRNVIHCSDSPESSAREITLWFNEDEVLNYETVGSRVMYTKDWYQHTDNK